MTVIVVVISSAEGGSNLSVWEDEGTDGIKMEFGRVKWGRRYTAATKGMGSGRGRAAGHVPSAVPAGPLRQNPELIISSSSATLTQTKNKK